MNNDSGFYETQQETTEAISRICLSEKDKLNIKKYPHMKLKIYNKYDKRIPDVQGYY